MVLDGIVILFVVLSVFLGYKKGFVGLAIKLVALIVAILVTFILYQPVSNFIINTTGVDETIENAIYEKATQALKGETQENNYTNALKNQLLDGTLPQTSRTLSINIIKIIVIIILFIVTKILIMCISSLANSLAKLPIVKQCNKLGGIIYGLLRGVLIIFVFFAVIELYTQITPQNAVYNEIEKSSISKMIYENNIITMFFK